MQYGTDALLVQANRSRGKWVPCFRVLRVSMSRICPTNLCDEKHAHAQKARACHPLRLSASSGERFDKRRVLPWQDGAKIEDNSITFDASENGEAGRSQQLVERLNIASSR